jgi:hypothetical protein
MSALDTILAHPLTKRVLPFNRVATRNGSVKLRGLTKPMKKIFFSAFKRPRKGKTSSSKKIGIKVHAQVETYVKTGKLPKRPHAFTSQAVEFLQKKHLDAKMMSEVPLLSAKGKFLTYADLLCEKDGELTVVSLKTGYPTKLNSGKATCAHLPEKTKNSYLSHHIVQLALEVACIERDLGVSVKDAYILYVGLGSKKKLKVVPLPRWARTEQLGLLKAMAEH